MCLIKKETIEFIIKLFNIDDNTKKNIKEYYELMKELHYFF